MLSEPGHWTCTAQPILAEFHAHASTRCSAQPESQFCECNSDILFDTGGIPGCPSWGHSEGIIWIPFLDHILCFWGAVPGIWHLARNGPNYGLWPKFSLICHLHWNYGIFLGKKQLLQIYCIYGGKISSHGYSAKVSFGKLDLFVN